MIGTPGYIPPEQAVGAPLDARGDLYALGCVAWWLLTGGEVYPNVAGDDLIRTHVTEPIPELARRAAGCRPSSSMLIVQCLAKRPEDRPHDARALADGADRDRDSRRSTRGRKRDGGRLVEEPARRRDQRARSRDDGCRDAASPREQADGDRRRPRRRSCVVAARDEEGRAR